MLFFPFLVTHAASPVSYRRTARPAPGITISYQVEEQKTKSDSSPVSAALESRVVLSLVCCQARIHKRCIPLVFLEINGKKSCSFCAVPYRRNLVRRVVRVRDFKKYQSCACCKQLLQNNISKG